MHFVTKTGRNDPCPCGSGKKYKRCCNDADRARGAPVLATSTRTSSSSREPILIIEDDGLDELSNSVLDLIRERRFEEALAACDRLLREFPDVQDGLERSGLVHAAMGNHAIAAEFFRRAVDFVTDPVRREYYDDEAIEWYREHLDREERLAGLR